MEGDRHYDDFSDEVTAEEPVKSYEQLVKEGIKASLDSRRGNADHSSLTAVLLAGTIIFAAAQCNEEGRGATLEENPIEYSVTGATFLE